MRETYVLKRLADTPATKCPCGDAFRIITAADNDRASFHVVRIRGASQRHLHRRHTEFYYCLEGTGQIALADEQFPFTPGTAVMIPPGTPHALRGDFKIVNVVIPPFDGEDEVIVG